VARTFAIAQHGYEFLAAVAPIVVAYHGVSFGIDHEYFFSNTLHLLYHLLQVIRQVSREGGLLGANRNHPEWWYVDYPMDQHGW
jgi:hypothetical protein